MNRGLFQSATCSSARTDRLRLVVRANDTELEQSHSGCYCMNECCGVDTESVLHPGPDTADPTTHLPLSPAHCCD